MSYLAYNYCTKYKWQPFIYLFQTAHYENLQDKLAKLKDAREALDALREEHNEKKRREQEEANRIRQIQMVSQTGFCLSKCHGLVS